MAKKDVNKTANLPAPADQAQDIAQSIADQLKKVAPQAQVSINPAAIPQNIAHNLLQFLQRVRVEGMEAVAWVEAYQYVQQFTPQGGQPQGVPFPGLPAKQA